MKKIIKLKCMNCGKIFNKELAEYKRQIKNGKYNFFCGHSCSGKYINQKNKNKEIKKECPVCKKQFITQEGKSERFFCSRSCASKGSVNEKRREAGRNSAKNNFSSDTYSVENIQYLLRKRENWKYKELQQYLDDLNICYEFEYIIGNYIYDLALIDKKIIIEFDGKEHNPTYDKDKNNTAYNNNWKVIRISVTPNTIIPIKSIEKIIRNLK